MKVLDLCAGENGIIEDMDVEEAIGSEWEEYYEEIREGSLDEINFDLEDIDKDVFIIDDGGELIRLKDGRYINICWRFSCCRVWEEDDEETIKHFNTCLNVN